MNLLKNAIDSISIGLEDYQSQDEKRMLSATRNICAGILLLFKHKLAIMSPDGSDEVLLKHKLLPSHDSEGNIVWVGEGKKTVDVHSIRQRFNSLCISIDWKRHGKITEYRNQIEHYFSTEDLNVARALVSDSFLIIRDFISMYLDEDPREVLGEHNWKVLFTTNEVQEKEKEESDEAIETLSFFSDVIMEAIKEYPCCECGYSVFTPSDKNGEATDVIYKCNSCGRKYAYAEIVGLAINSYFDWEIYEAGKNGYDLPLAECPECGGVYLYDEMVCAICGYNAVHECENCGETIIPCELASAPLCGYCEYRKDKYDL